MNKRELFNTLMTASKLEDVKSALMAFHESEGVSKRPFGGRPNNRGAIEVAADPARSAIERVTNEHDALLELEHARHGGTPECRTPREAAEAWFNVPVKDGLAGLTTKQRQDLANNAIVRLEAGEGWQSRILSIQDRGTGITPERMKDTILSLNESNKIQKHYLAGTYGQGGSSTLTFSSIVFIATRAVGSNKIGFTVAWYEDLPADEYKTGRYVYLIENDDVPVVDAKPEDFAHGTLIRHFGYDLSTYTASIGPKSLYGALQRIMFDPVLPIRFENKVAGWNRTIKGSRNALNGAADTGDDDTAKGPALDYHLPMFNLSLGDYGDIGIEYWVLTRPEVKDGKKTTKPSRNFVDDAKPIILTHNGQNQGELSGRLLKKEAELPFLQAQGRLIVHVNCDRLSASAKRMLFSSTREHTREGFIQSTIQRELIENLKADDELRRLNELARDQSLKDRDDAAEKQIQQQVAKLLRIVGPALVDAGGTKGAPVPSGSSTKKGGGSRKKPEPIETKEPPTFVRIVGDKDDAITFFGGQRKYIRIETDANSHYHDPDDPQKSRLNIALPSDMTVFGTSPLRGGRMRIGVQCRNEVVINTKGSIRVELYRPGLPTLNDERHTLIVEPPKPKEDSRQTPFPKFKIIAVDGPEDANWEYVRGEEESEDVQRHASGAEMSEGTLFVYYSTQFPRFVAERHKFEQQNPALVESFIRRYELWLAVHALMMHESDTDIDVADEKAAEEHWRQERCRLASIAAMFAYQEVKNGVNTEDTEEAA